jgi:hypothetical protein
LVLALWIKVLGVPLVARGLVVTITVVPADAINNLTYVKDVQGFMTGGEMGIPRSNMALPILDNGLL